MEQSIFEEMKDENFPKLMKGINHRSKKVSETQVG
jgi:hypothetical protein